MAKFMTTAVTGVFACLSLVTPAQALNSRTWISGKGTDVAGCGPIATPCRSLQFAHDQTLPAGEIDVLDPAGYGSVVITKAINIINEGGIAGVLAGSGGNAITINAGATDAVVLRGLTIEGSHAGANGVVFNSGGSLTIAKCLVQNFAGSSSSAGNGILIRHTSGLPSIVVTDTTASNNGYVGMFVLPSGSGGGSVAVTGLTVSNNQYGFSVYTGYTSGPGAYSRVMIEHSRALNNSQMGFQLYGPSGSFLQVWLMDSVATGLGGTDIYANGVNNGTATVIRIGRTVAAGYVNIVGDTFACSFGGNIMENVTFACNGPQL